MNEIKLNIDGIEVKGFEGQTILEIARENNIYIPTLCYDERLETNGSGACGICIVEVTGSPRLFRSCSTLAANGMVINTNTERIRKNRKTALELLLSDHAGDCIAPCVLACPAHTNCQGYVELIAKGEYAEALKIIKDRIPLPASIGRVCPHPCEEACRRELVEEPISICSLKQFAGDLNIDGSVEINTPTGKNIAIIGGGPGGLSAAYYLKIMGHDITIYDAMPKMGGMLQYGVPEYRLPEKILQDEISAIEKMGIIFKNNIRIGKDITLDEIRKNYDAVIVAVGAWASAELKCKGDNLDGVLSAVDFLVKIHEVHKYDFTGLKVAVVGGGDIAMDACRTAVRLGADKVYNIYRRTKNEMPANIAEIAGAEEESVIFKNLTNPIEIIGDSNNKVKAVRLQIMELGEPDSSGRRSPVAIPGKEETLEADIFIIAIGQKLNNHGFEELELTKSGTIIADEHTFRTNLNGVFAIGEATNKGADIAISAIGAAKKASETVNRYLNGEQLKYEVPYLVKSEKTPEDFINKEKFPRVKTKQRNPVERRNNFLEIVTGLTEDEAKKEASRCMSCGCHAYSKCKLIDYANKYKTQPEKYMDEHTEKKATVDFSVIEHNPDKCILCGLCVRICGEVAEETLLGFTERGFNTIIKPAYIDSRDTECCKTCGKCVDACPTGALKKCGESID